MKLPDRSQQIVITHAAFIRQAVELIQRPDTAGQLEALLKQELRGAEGLDEEDGIIAEAILRGLQDTSTLPDADASADPALAAPGLAHMIHAAGHGDVRALTLVSQMAEQMSRVGGDMARVAAVIRPLINGDRDPDRLCERLDRRGQQLVLQILEELGRLGSH